MQARALGGRQQKYFVRRGAKIIVGAQREKELHALVSEINEAGGEAVALAGDVTKESYNKALVDLAIASFGKLDIALNNAGTLSKGGITELSIEDWQATIETNLSSAFLAAKYQIPAMLKQGGSIIFTSSFVGHSVGMPGMAAYSASKAGQIGLMKSLASEYGPQGIRVNAILPGATQTPMAEEFGTDPSVIEFVSNMHALKRQAEPEEIARSVVYLASDASSFTTGTAMLVDGGVSVCKT